MITPPALVDIEAEYAALSHCPTCARPVTWRSKSGFCHRHSPKPRKVRQPIRSDDCTHWLIPLTRGLFARIDTADLPHAFRRNWCAANAGEGRFYAQARIDGRTVTLHRLVARARDGDSVDHINGDTLDNRRSNLRLCTQAQNSLNRRAAVGSTSAYKGVSWSKSNKGWIAQIRANGVRRHLGTFSTAEAAARAYDAAAAEMHGAFAKFNLPIRVVA